uniref:Uncharacterized protein n=1 Tax=Lactuca sativa TaxID=4236 RepID=A0A9R1WKE2_LACSA|nr:hypothetical protein LSAT_V11C100013830 [Lactuca sativa]
MRIGNLLYPYLAIFLKSPVSLFSSLQAQGDGCVKRKNRASLRRFHMAIQTRRGSIDDGCVKMGSRIKGQRLHPNRMSPPSEPNPDASVTPSAMPTDIEDEIMDEKNLTHLDEDDIALLKTYVS